MEKGTSLAALCALLNDDIKNFLVASIPGGIEAQEKQGQTEFVANSTLPKRFNSGTKEELEQMGIIFGEDVDDLFVEVQLPQGWKKEATEHSMWSNLLDEKGRKRASVFYKAAFYDRDAFISVYRRFSASRVQHIMKIRGLPWSKMVKRLFGVLNRCLLLRKSLII